MILTDLEICVLALQSTYNMKRMDKILPYGVKNRLKWKNGLFFKKSGKEVNRKIKELNKSEKQMFQNMMSTIFSPRIIYAFFRQNNIIVQIYISQVDKVKFEEIDKGVYEITEISDEEETLEQYMGVKKSVLYSNSIYDEDLDIFEIIQEEYIKGRCIDEKMEEICAACEKLNNPEYTLVISSYFEEEKQVEIIVWDVYEGILHFCSTVNKGKGSRIRLGTVKNCGRR